MATCSGVEEEGQRQTATHELDEPRNAICDDSAALVRLREELAKEQRELEADRVALNDEREAIARLHAELTKKAAELKNKHKWRN